MAGKVLPDYRDGSIVNLMASILAAYGRRSKYHQLKGLSGKGIAKYRNVVLVVLDGLGYHLLMRHAQAGFLAGNLRRKMTTVFPSTTAAAITSFVTGLAPEDHAFVGWFTYLREFGMVSTILPFVPRMGGLSFGMLGLDPKAFFGLPTLSERIREEKHLVTQDKLVGNDYAQMTVSEDVIVHPHHSLQTFANGIERSVRSSRRRKFVYAYWPRVDSLCHRFGTADPAVSAHIAELDRAFGRLKGKLKGTRTLFLITADHGLVDTPRRININTVPGMRDCLVLPLSGEPRAAYCFVRMGKEREFRAIWRRHLKGDVELFRTKDIIARHYFGLGKPPQRFLERCGDYMLIPKDGTVISDFLYGEPEHYFVGNHGGLSAEEMEVPLITFSP